ncbi:MAG TPA: fructosamine kinase family protein, partial [Anaerolineales bacterium]|nr:fructosamine kinase family protein [Anaerolineales bacterium]
MGINPHKVPNEVEDWLLAQGAGPIQVSRPVSGGCISSGRVLMSCSGSSYFLKTNVEVPEDFFPSEAVGLAELAIPGGVRVPEVYLYGKEFILMEDLGAGEPGERYWESLGSGLAAIHQHTSQEFGFKADNFIGTTPQPNMRGQDGFRFFAEQRLNFQTVLAHQRGLLENRHLRQVDRLIQR